MAEPLDEWVETNLPLMDSKPVKELSHEFFFRDPPRPNFINHELFYSPSDGVILYQKVVNPDDKVIEIKGKNYTLKDVMRDDEFDKPSLVIGIFMTFLDVHINRIPYSGILKYERLDPIESTNKPMLAVEKDLLNKVVNPNNMGYLKYNERCLNTIYSPLLNYEYHLIQIADEDVNVIAPFKHQGDIVNQNERFSLIRWGSQVDLVLPLDDNFKFETLVPDAYHVKGGIDPLVKIIF